jgi:hypothetical protein
MIDPDSGARGAIRDSRRSGAERFLWTLVVFGSHQWAAGRTEELGNARSQAEAALAGYAAAWREMARQLGLGNSFARLLCCPAQAERGRKNAPWVR